jgi:hypothetical protein
VPAAAIAQDSEKTIVFVGDRFGSAPRPGAELPGAAEFAGPFTVR